MVCNDNRRGKPEVNTDTFLTYIAGQYVTKFSVLYTITLNKASCKMANENTFGSIQYTSTHVCRQRSNSTRNQFNFPNICSNLCYNHFIFFLLLLHFFHWKKTRRVLL